MNIFSKFVLGSAVLMVAGNASAANVKITDTKPGSGTEAVKGKNVTVHYDGYLSEKGEKGKKFDSSKSRGPFTFGLGAHQVIEGWEAGVQGMKVGGQRTLVIPPEMGYGAAGAGGVIPPNAELIFDIELLDVK